MCGGLYDGNKHNVEHFRTVETEIKHFTSSFVGPRLIFRQNMVTCFALVVIGVASQLLNVKVAAK